MQILSHRGYWKDPSEKNQSIAFERSFSMGFGTETDIRDYNGNLVISHDIADENCVKASDFFKLYNSFNTSLPLALNIKADGLQEKLGALFTEYKIENYFLFDMSVPDGLICIKHNLKVFSRESEYETIPSFYDRANGIWLDEFQGHWITQDTIKKHLKNNKRLCIVSPDLHNRRYADEWRHYKQIEKELGINHLMLCTDYPEIAKEFFSE